jgi:ribosome-associated translation inhibitor RaiA
MDSSEAIEQDIRRRAARLERFHPRLTRCHVVVDVPHRHRHKGNHFVMRIDLATPHGEVCVTQDPSPADDHVDFKAVIRDAFEAAHRRLSSQQREPSSSSEHDQLA